jgi:predicted DNA repair protein MutK
MEKTIKSSAINYGLYLGALLSAITVVCYAVNLELLTKWWLGIGIFIAIIVFGIISTSKSKSLMDGFIEFKEAFSSYFITVAIGIIISMIITLILFNLIDPDAALVLKEKTIEVTIEMMRNFGAPEEAVAQTLEQMEAQKNTFEIGPQIQSNVIFLVMQAVIGLIVALIMKRSKQNVE